MDSKFFFDEKNPFLAHMVSQIIDLRLKHITLRWLQLEAVFS